MRQPLPIWSIPFLLALVGIVAWVGHLSPTVLLIVVLETLIVSGYMIFQSRGEASERQPSSNLLTLFPGHLLVLIIIALLDEPNVIAVVRSLIEEGLRHLEGLVRNIGKRLTEMETKNDIRRRRDWC